MPNLDHERRALRQGFTKICGVDEAGRGPLAGPVVAAAVILPDVAAPWGGLPKMIGAFVNDSKKLSPSRRRSLADGLHRYALTSVAISSVEDIDRLNILQASLLAMNRAIHALPTVPDMALVDGNRSPSARCQTQCLVQGDALSLSIAAASIVAKVFRDGLMRELAQKYPLYGWDKNQGYGTAQHMEALKKYGSTPHHRRSFAPVAQASLFMEDAR